jgi:hypothetical protein
VPRPRLGPDAPNHPPDSPASDLADGAGWAEGVIEAFLALEITMVSAATLEARGSTLELTGWGEASSMHESIKSVLVSHNLFCRKEGQEPV